MVTLVLAIAVSSAAPTSAAETFLAQLQRAVAGQDRRAVAALVQFPLLQVTGILRVPIANLAQLVERYDNCFTPEIRAMIGLSGIARRGSPRPAHPIVVSPDGLTMGNGAVWAKRVGASYRVARVIVPPEWLTRPHIRDAQRIPFRSGQASALRSGRLAALEAQSYLVTIAAGQRLEVRLESDGRDPRDALFRIVHHARGRPIDAAAGAGATTWSGAVTDGGDYRIDIARVSRQGAAEIVYRLAVALR
jgi:hypothetical protein